MQEGGRAGKSSRGRRLIVDLPSLLPLNNDADSFEAQATSNLRGASNGNARFNDEAKSWDARPFVHEASQAAAKAILERLKALPKQPKQVLEIGCGTGILSFLMAPQVDRVVAVDAAEGMIEVLKQKLQKPDAPKNIVPVAVLLEDPNDRALPPADDSRPENERQKFDLITSHLVLHHIPDLQSVLKTMLGCLALGGRVMLTDFEDFGPQAKRFHPASKMAGVERHGINAKEMAELMRDVGFAAVDVKPAWTMSKRVEKHDGEFGDAGPKPELGEIMDFPFLLCYGERAT
ncbi:hypothetical protein LTR56_011653 [Elasticomyces elasticus]|nr:hypothetical protein LTR56_011653 [Elasticomyces elasticus]KAK3658560.1 hypothetical protein LTR22_008913 [Elasticomyces elasticus]KAK4921209.1 hypothetical protein LTR49_011396 [Elasticomyces elasticus]KAK5761926.1 hypothetical protein LTS12_007989 [Elasticomyces elasticus]